MALVYGAIAEGHFEVVGWISSLGKAGVNKDGTLKDDACLSLERARRRAIKTVVNKLRNRKYNHMSFANSIWIKFKDLPAKFLNQLIDEVEITVQWKMIGPTLYRGRVNELAILNATQRVLA